MIKDLEKMLQDSNKKVIGFSPISDWLNGEMKRMENGNLRMTIEFPPEILKELCKGIPLCEDDYSISPVVVFAKKEDQCQAIEEK